MRLNKFMAECGVASRRACDQIIEEGRVRVNGKKVVDLGVSINEDIDNVSVDGKNIKSKKLIYIMLHKPKGYVTTVSDDLERKTVMELVAEIKTRVYPVGRLDYDTEGLLLMTNDGNLTNKLTHPKHEVSKTYIAKIEGKISEKELNELKAGVIIDGKKTLPCEAKITEVDEKYSKVEISIREGKNHQIKKMFEAIVKNVIFLKRTAVGEIKLGGLTRGTWRYLNDKEMDYLRSL